MLFPLTRNEQVLSHFQNLSRNHANPLVNLQMKSLSYVYHWLPTWHLHVQATGYQVQMPQARGNTSVWKIDHATSVGTPKASFRYYRSHVRYATKCLRKHFCKSIMTNLKGNNTGKWWKRTKQLLGQTNDQEEALKAMDINEYDGNIKLLAEKICSKASLSILTWLHSIWNLFSTILALLGVSLEYACPAWFTSVKHTGHMWELELIQIRSLKIIFPELSSKEALIQSNLCTLEVRLTKLYSNFFNNM